MHSVYRCKDNTGVWNRKWEADKGVGSVYTRDLVGGSPPANVVWSQCTDDRDELRALVQTSLPRYMCLASSQVCACTSGLMWHLHAANVCETAKWLGRWRPCVHLVAISHAALALSANTTYSVQYAWACQVYQQGVSWAKIQHCIQVSSKPKYIMTMFPNQNELESSVSNWDNVTLEDLLASSMAVPIEWNPFFSRGPNSLTVLIRHSDSPKSHPKYVPRMRHDEGNFRKESDNFDASHQPTDPWQVISHGHFIPYPSHHFQIWVNRIGWNYFIHVLKYFQAFRKSLHGVTGGWQITTQPHGR
jgi:hypothetical protein